MNVWPSNNVNLHSLHWNLWTQHYFAGIFVFFWTQEQRSYCYPHQRLTAWARQEKFGKRVTTNIGHKDLVLTQHGLAQFYSIKERKSDEAKQQLARLRESFPVEMKVNRVISERNIKAEGKWQEQLGVPQNFKTQTRKMQTHQDKANAEKTGKDQ